MREGMRMRSVHSNKHMALKADIDPAPTPWPLTSVLAFIAVVSLLFVQFILPATHVRHPADPHRVWIPIEQLNAHTLEENMTANIDKRGVAPDIGKGSLVIVMTKEMDLRPLFVVLNSTISNTKREPKLHFGVILPSSLPESECMKLKALFPNVKIQIIRDGYIIKRIESSMRAKGTFEKDSKLLELVPFFLAEIFPSFERFVYLESDAVLQGDIEELIELDMQGKPVAAVEDCSQEFETYFSMDLLEAARLSLGDGKPALPAQPYEPKTCMFDKGTLVVDQKAWKEERIMEAMHWWIGMYHRTTESLYGNGHVELPFYLALYCKCNRLDTSWSVRGSMTYAKASAAKLVHFDKEHKPWHQARATNFKRDVTGLWWKYISPATSKAFGME